MIQGVYILLSLAIIWGLFRSGRSLIPGGRSLVHSLSGLIVLYVAIVLTGQFLSCLHLLRAGVWIGLLLAVWGLVLWLQRKFPPVPVTYVSDSLQTGPTQKTEFLLLVMTLIFAAIGGQIPVHATDMVTYHLPRAALWLEHQSTFLPVQPIARLRVIGVNISLLYAFALSFWTAAWIPLFHAAAFWMVGASALLLARKKGLTECKQRFVLVLVVGIPPLLDHTLGGGVDVFLAAGGLGSIVLIVVSRGRRVFWLIAGALAGLLLGAKGSFIPVFGCIFLWVVHVAWREKVVAGGIQFVVAAALCGGFSYAQNWLMVGHPFGGEVFRLLHSNPSFSNFTGNAERLFFADTLDGYDVLFRVLPMWFWLTMLVVALSLSFRRQDLNMACILGISLVSVTAGIFLIRGSEAGVLIRLLMPGMCIGWVAGTIEVLRCKKTWVHIAIALLTSVLAFLSLAHQLGPLPGGALVSYSRSQGSWDRGLLFKNPLQVAGFHYPGRLELFRINGYFDDPQKRFGYIGRRNAWMLRGARQQHHVVYVDAQNLLNADSLDRWFEENHLDALFLEGRVIKAEKQTIEILPEFKRMMMNELPVYDQLDFSPILEKFKHAGHRVQESESGPIFVE